uniref:Uncharacterized protein n=1 Tax=Kalanchoe fedtschenkoi TaxID=63787 RepID=A0A7N0UD11_KALFE
MADYRKERSLEGTPTWAVAVVCFVLVVISILIEHLIHLVGHVSLHMIFVTDKLIVAHLIPNFCQPDFFYTSICFLFK